MRKIYIGISFLFSISQTFLSAQTQMLFCPGSSNASIGAPLGYVGYLWIPPAGFPIPVGQSTMASISITNAVVGNVYTLNLISPSNFITTSTHTLAYTPLSIIAIGSSSTCIGGASGSATVAATGGNMFGYNYTWINSTNSVVSNAQVANNLLPGSYTAQVSVLNSPSCGTVIATTTVNTNMNPGVINWLKPYCNNEAYLSFPGGNSYQWYSGTLAIPANQGGTAPSYTVANPVNLSIYNLSYVSAQGCHDSIKITLVSVASGTSGISYNQITCQNANNGMAVVSITPAAGSQLGANYFSVSSSGSLTLPYSASINPTALYTFTANNLSANGTYSYTAFDGMCKYNGTFTTNTLPAFDFTLSPNASTLCLNSAFAIGPSFSNQQSGAQFTYSWSPPNYLAGTQQQSTIVQNNGNQNPVTNIIYSVVVTPTLANCPLTRTFSVTFINAPTPIINLNQIPNLCNNSPSFTLSAVPSNGYFYGNAVSSVGVIYPNLATVGSPNTFIYSSPSCASSATGSFAVLNSTIMSVSSNTSLLSGQSVTLQAFGANSYTWSNGVQSFSNVVSPCATTIYSVIAKDTLNNCMVQQSVNVNVQTNITINGNTTIYTGQSTTIQASGSTTYTWSNGVTSYANVLSPCISTIFSVAATTTLNNCVSQNTVLITVQPNLHITGNFSICAGQNTLLQATGANTYTWNNASQGSSIIAAPMVPSLYSVSGTTNNCVTQTSVIVYVYLYPLIHITGNNKLCIGESTILHVSGPSSYTWTTLSSNSSLTVAPITQTSYTVLGSNTLNSCSNTAVFTISVNPLPDVTIDGNVNLCDGENIFTTLTGQGADSYSWNIFSNATSILVYPVNNSFYSVIGTNTTTGCKNYYSVSVSISDCTGFEEQEREMTLLTIFPNPSTGLFFIEATMPLSISIYNQVGALVLNNKLESGKTEINLRGFSAGIYFIKADNKNKSEVTKFIKVD